MVRETFRKTHNTKKTLRWTSKASLEMYALGMVTGIGLATMSFFLSSTNTGIPGDAPSLHHDHHHQQQQQQQTTPPPTTKTTTNTTTDPSFPYPSPPITGFPRKRRQNAHWCRRPGKVAQTRQTIRVLKEEFGFDREVDARFTDDFDIIFGGYPHCGSEDWDFEMKTGLNDYLLHQKGFQNLQPHQVWYPCMGCKDAYCNKRELCRIVRDYIDPNACFLLPEDKDRLVQVLDGTKLWVMKRDSSTMHKHIGSNVFFIQKESDIPKDDDTDDMTYLVQPFTDPYLGPGKYHRKSEVRFYIAVTSTQPLRAYIYKDQWATLASHPYEEGKLEKCILDTHPDHIPCTNIGIEQHEKSLTFALYVQLAKISDSDANIFLERTRALLGKIVRGAEPILQTNEINRNITHSGASCFHHMRVDVGISKDLVPYVFEINEFNSWNRDHFGKQRRSQYDSFKDLINMIGLDQYPLPASERSAYEKAHLGGWIEL